MHIAMDCTIEKAAHLGLIMLACSDLCYCIISLQHVMLVRSQTFFYSKNLRFYLKIYGPYIRNCFSHFSTWLTVIMAVGRFAAICYPLHARHLVRVKPTVFSIIFVFILWLVINLPRLWEHSIKTIDCPAAVDTTVYILDHGYFTQHEPWRLTFRCLWFSIGFFIPLLLLTYCNIRLIDALRESYKIRRTYRVSGQTQQIGRHITPTLIAIVLMYIILVSPSEIVNFISYFINVDAHIEAFRLVMSITNAMHTLNFAINFILYLIVNIYFRNTVRDMLICVNIIKSEREKVVITTQMRRARFVTTYSSVSTKSSNSFSTIVPQQFRQKPAVTHL